MGVRQHPHGKCGGARASVGLSTSGPAIDLQGRKPRSIGLGERTFFRRASLVPWAQSITQLLSSGCVSPIEIGTDDVFDADTGSSRHRVINRDQIAGIDRRRGQKVGSAYSSGEGISLIESLMDGSCPQGGDDERENCGEACESAKPASPFPVTELS